MLNLSKLVVYPDGNNPQIYHGCMNIKNERFKIKFSNPSNNKLNKDNMICEMDGKLSQILYHCQPVIENTLIKCKTPEQFINELYNILHKTLDISSINTSISSTFYSKICRQLDIIGWECIKQISSDMTQFILNTQPNKDNNIKHELHFKIIDANKFPNTKPIITAKQLPLSFEFQWTSDELKIENDNNSDNDDAMMDINKQISKYNHILNVIKQYNYECEKYKIFWRILEDFYENTIVLEPRHINYGCNVLRILLDKDKRSIIEIELDPSELKCQNYKCKCKFYGINDEIIEYGQKWNDIESNEIWNNELFPRENIEEILDVRFIYNDDDENDIVDTMISVMECAMCLEFKTDENMIPDVVCKSCKQSFHKKCILEWFNSLESVVHHYTSIEGKCPHCEKPMSFDVFCG